MTIHKIDDKTEFVEVYHLIMKSVDSFQYLSPNIPKQFLNIVQKLYVNLYNASCYVRGASNTFDNDEKVELVTKAKIEILDVYTALEIIVKGKGLTIGAANTVIDVLSDVMDQCNKWNKALKRSSKQDLQGAMAAL